MSAVDLIVWLLIALGVALSLLSCIGVAAFSDRYDRLHFTGPGTLLAPLPIAAAVVVEQGPIAMGAAKSVLVALLLVVTGPLAAHAMARAFRIRGDGGWTLRDSERVPEEEL